VAVGVPNEAGERLQKVGSPQESDSAGILGGFVKYHQLHPSDYMRCFFNNKYRRL
jgi:hypothetical protein